jgi:hypothetical protein
VNHSVVPALAIAVTCGVPAVVPVMVVRAIIPFYELENKVILTPEMSFEIQFLPHGTVEQPMPLTAVISLPSAAERAGAH